MENREHHGSGFLNGFVIGLLVGVGIALMVTTKKGRHILRTLSEEGLEKVTNFDELLQKFERAAERATSQPEEDDIEGEDYVPQQKVLLAEADTNGNGAKKVALPPIQINTTVQDDTIHDLTADLPDEEEEVVVPRVKPTRRRFFRGIPKRG